MIIFLLAVIVVLCVISMRYSYKLDDLKWKVQELEEDVSFGNFHNEYLINRKHHAIESIRKDLDDTNKILNDEKVLWGLEFGDELSGKNIGAVVLFSSRSGARQNKKKGDKVVKVNYRIVK